jgi:hypothetical protein
MPLWRGTSLSTGRTFFPFRLCRQNIDMIIERLVLSPLTVERERQESIVEEQAKGKVMREMWDILL